MRRVQCYDCGKRYDFDIDDFCPRCGAFNQPGKTAQIGADGRVVRLDGINEANHACSFVHQELHQENRQRRGTELERDEPALRPILRMPAQPARKKPDSKTQPLSILRWVILAVVGLRFLSALLSALIR